MLYRKIESLIEAHLKSESKRILLIDGARQVGKTYIIRYVGNKLFENFIEINMVEDSLGDRLFAETKTVEDFYLQVSMLAGNKMKSKETTLIFIDEIQAYPHLLTLLKFLSQDNRFNYIASGSLLGVTLSQTTSIPMGSIRKVRMFPLDFEEFLWAYGYGDETIAYLKSFYTEKEKIPPEIQEKFEALLREYLVVGGMPEVVASFAEFKDFTKVHEIQEKILSSYADDISQHAKGAEKVKVRACYDSIPRQLAKENKKFKYSEVESKATARKYGDSVQWLRDANMAYMCYNTTTPILPLKAYEKENEFKLYMADTGLLMALFGFATKQALLNGNLKGFAKGGIYENFVAQTLVKNGYTLHYYKQGDSSELEFLIEKDGEVIPIEVKAGNNPTKSLDMFVRNFEPSTALKLTGGNVGISDKKLSMPHFLSMFI